MGSLLDGLRNHFPYQFERLPRDAEFFPGWGPALAKACEQIDAELGDDKRGWHWTQIKEKFGVARLYFRFGCGKANSTRIDIVSHAAMANLHLSHALADSVAAKIHDIVGEAEAATANQCMVCGGPAQLRLYDGWWATLCDRHPPIHGDDGCWRLPESDD